MSRMTDDQLTVGQAAQRLGVTVRTLHHWDAEGLAQPSARSAAGYRLYTQADLDRLERVVLYRELGLGHNAICGLLDDPDMDAVATLHEQSAQTEEHIHRLQQLQGSLRNMIEAHERGPLVGPERQEEVLGEGWNPDWPAQARARWGHTAQWRQYAERAAVRAPEGWSELTRETEELDGDLVRAVDDGAVPGDARANDLVERHRKLFSRYFPLTRQMQVCLGRVYESDPAFAAHYDALHPGLAMWLREAIDESARLHGIDPDTASWE